MNQSIWKILVKSKWVHLPHFLGVKKNQHIWVATTQKYVPVGLAFGLSTCPLVGVQWSAIGVNSMCAAWMLISFPSFISCKLNLYVLSPLMLTVSSYMMLCGASVNTSAVKKKTVVCTISRSMNIITSRNVICSLVHFLAKKLASPHRPSWWSPSWWWTKRPGRYVKYRRQKEHFERKIRFCNRTAIEAT